MARCKHRLQISLALILTTCLSAGCSTTNAVESNNKNAQIQLFLQDSPMSESELYADWAAYLNDFKSAEGENLSINHALNASPTLNNINLNGFKEKYSTLFVVSDHACYLYTGPILEPAVYDFIHKISTQQDIPEFLTQFSPEALKGRLTIGEYSVNCQ
ncbi:hypothetical protein O5O45_15785 [Hahella aquimaris]|uniref:hypothetical protein n=1 Tax=Hahella sp. HNIBRBA332 TaxID=3015983 RepID=UPI00273C7286|nr:hypothetical protein [Hahella sp. HNIBRBA332]WLQ17373.1 hypothetical protein O5O45_15785 [Hahella sp. HNIBRBA332]